MILCELEISKNWPEFINIEKFWERQLFLNELF